MLLLKRLGKQYIDLVSKTILMMIRLQNQKKRKTGSKTISYLREKNTQELELKIQEILQQQLQINLAFLEIMNKFTS